MKNKARFFTTKPTRDGKMLFIRNRQIGSIYFDAPTKSFWLSMQKAHFDFASFADAEVYAWTHSAYWL